MALYGSVLYAIYMSVLYFIGLYDCNEVFGAMLCFTNPGPGSTYFTLTINTKHFSVSPNHSKGQYYLARNEEFTYLKSEI